MTDSISHASEVDNIRAILFGDQIKQIETRFEALEKAISNLRNENHNLRQALEAEVTLRERSHQQLVDSITTLEKDINARMAARRTAASGFERAARKEGSASSRADCPRTEISEARASAPWAVSSSF